MRVRALQIGNLVHRLRVVESGASPVLADVCNDLTTNAELPSGNAR